MTTLTPLPFNAKPIAPATKSLPFSSAPVAPASIPDIISQHNIEQAKTKNLGDFSADAIKEGVDKIKSSVESGAEDIQKGGVKNVVKGAGESALGTTSGFLQTLFSPVTAVISKTADAVGNNPIIQKLSQSGFGDAIAKGEQGFNDWAKAHPELATNLSDALNVGLAGLTGGEDIKTPDLSVVKDDLGKIVDTTKKVASITKDTVGNTAETVADHIPFKEIPGKMVRRAGDAIDAHADIKAQPKEIQTAIKADIPRPQAEFINNMTPETKALASDMLKKQVNGTEKLVMKPSERPDAVIGQRALEPVKFLEDQKKTSQINEGEHVKNLTGKPVDLSTTKTNFLDKLKTLGVEQGEDGKLDFSKSELTTPASAKDRGLLQTTFEELKNENPTAGEAHTIRQRLFNETQGKNFTEPFSDRIVDIVHNNRGTSVRSDILHAIRDQAGGTGEGYAAEATKNAKIQDALQQFYKSFGKDLGGKEINIQNLKAGEVSNRLGGNASSNVESALQKVENLAREYGYKSNTSTRELVAFKTIIKNIVGETQHNSLAGAMEQGTKAALPDAVDVMGHGASGDILGAGKAILKFAKGNTKAEQIRALEELLKPKSKSSSIDPILGF